MSTTRRQSKVRRALAWAGASPWVPYDAHLPRPPTFLHSSSSARACDDRGGRSAVHASRDTEVDPHQPGGVQRGRLCHAGAQQTWRRQNSGEGVSAGRPSAMRVGPLYSVPLMGAAVNIRRRRPRLTLGCQRRRLSASPSGARGEKQARKGRGVGRRRRTRPAQDGSRLGSLSPAPSHDRSPLPRAASFP